ncbi:glycosyltransferase family 2 protein [Oryzomonas rubra]|uniref:Glycosyltransferase n=1 Tax=Oryzomonas rubra TaxID=2509454 RepID=A0A5A9XME7_9BACT|nr:glycosyltransferase family 2 protein [Oryzomonas rubra]KAA0893319.1 glycosyltransferase [Oryzomonas rubra]
MLEKSAIGRQPAITIITVVYNGVEHLEDTITSVLGQTYKNLEYIVIDGGSTDGTVDVIRKYQSKISYWVSEKDNGIYDAMNKGWEAAKENSYILFLGAGDKVLSLPPDMDKYEFDDVIYGRVELGNGRFFSSKASIALRVRNTLHHQALLVNKSVHPELPFDTRFKIFADFDFNQRLLKKGANFVYSDAFVGYAMPAGLSSRYDLAESLQVVRKNFGLVWSFLALLYFLARRTFVRSRDLFTR